MSATAVTALTAVLVADDFGAPVGPGQVVGSLACGDAAGGGAVVRGGVDVEGALSVDGGALRIAPLDDPGWGRSSLAYGPFETRPGLALSVHVLNGHHASQTYALRRLWPQVKRWMVGSETVSLRVRLPKLVRSARRVAPLRRVRTWARHRGVDTVHLRDNLAVGLFDSPAPRDAGQLAGAFVVRSTGVGNGELSVRLGDDLVPVADRLTNLPMRLVVAVREGSVLYGLAVQPGARCAPAPEGVRPLAVGLGPVPPVVHAGIQQMVSGEIGFSVDTRVFGVRAALVPDLAEWCAGAHLADALLGSGPLAAAPPARGGPWSVTGALTRSERGLVAGAAGASAHLDAPCPSGLIHARLGPDDPHVGICWRIAGGSHWRVDLDGGEWWLGTVTGTDRTCAAHGALPGGAGGVQVLDDGSSVRLVAGARLLAHVDAPAAGSPGGGLELLALAPGELGITHLEAHPRQVELPDVVALPGVDVPRGWTLQVEDRFEQPDGDAAGGRRADLDGHTSTSGHLWHRRLGQGRIGLGDGAGAVVVEAPGRTLYTVDWHHPELAELRARILPVGRPKAKSRAGLVFMQDDDDYVVFNLWFNTRADGAASVSSFFCLGGLEDVYDAVWVNVGDRIRWDEPVDLRVAFDGGVYQVWLGEEPVLWRSLRDVYPGARRLAIRRVGIATNWEWGLDTGSRFLAFRAYGP